jgi:hypothetical protein
MTAINFAVRRDALFAIADAAVYAPDGTVQGFTGKVYPIPHLCAVVAARGNVLAAPMAASALGLRFRTFDALVDGLEAAFEQFCGRFFPSDDTVQLLIGGYSHARASFELLFVSSHPDLADRNAGLAPTQGTSIQPSKGVAVKLGCGFHAGPALPVAAFVKAFDRPLLSLDDITQIDVFARGVLELQRELRLGRELGANRDFCAVGGFGTLTSVTRAGIETGVIIEWPDDKAGAPLEPKPIDWPRWRAANPLPPAELQAPAAGRIRKIVRSGVRKRARGKAR